MMLLGAGAETLAQAPAPKGQRPAQVLPPGPNPDGQYRLGPDSLPQEGVPKGQVKGPFKIDSSAYPGTFHTYWVYVPAQYDLSLIHI